MALILIAESVWADPTGARPILEQHDILHVPGANEELAATAISGTQMLDNFPHAHVDGVTSLWYGKGPGVDRSGDALKHGNFAGTSKLGGWLYWVNPTAFIA